jgi:dCTP deaminase
VILTGYAIENAVEKGDIVIDPYSPRRLNYESIGDDGQINPASYDLRLGDEVVVYDRWVRSEIEKGREKPDGLYIQARQGNTAILDVKEEPKVTKFKISNAGWVLWPGIGYLMCTKECVSTTRYNPIIDGKSSTGRLFVKIHETAGYGDPFFDGQYTLEVTAMHPIRLYADMLIAQIRFHRLEGAIMPYRGNYRGEAARGPVASRAYKQFLPKEEK